MDADQPMCTAATPKPVRDLEADAMRAYRAKYPDGTLWQELDSSTRCVWVAYTEIQRGNDGVEASPEMQSPPEGGEGLASQKATSEGCPSKQCHCATALQRIADMDPAGKRADDLGRAARMARDALSAAGVRASDDTPNGPQSPLEQKEGPA